MLHSNKIPLAKTGIYACGVSHQTAVASAKPDTKKQENSMTCRFIQVFVSRIDNPQYTKLVILNGQYHWDYAVYVTHYAIDPDTYQGYDISLPCPKCGNLVRGEKGTVMSCSECGQDISLTL